MTWIVTGLTLWLAFSLVIGVLVGRGIALADSREPHVPQPSHQPSGRPGLTTSSPWITAIRASTGS
jgi:hypothetical protein